MHPNAELITRFYEAFQRKDADAMAACYHDDVRFSDPAFPDLRGAEAGDMWRMLCRRGKDLTLEFSGVEADDERGKAHWDATYTFQGRPVLNRIDAAFRFRDGKIVEHVDTFDFGVWSKQALGLTATLLGWTGLLQGMVQRTVKKDLAKFRSKQG